MDKLLSHIFDASTLTVLAHLSLVAGISLRVIMKRPKIGVALAWLVLTAAVPFLGAGMYLLIGERRVSRRRIRRIDEVRLDFHDVAQEAIQQGLTNVDWTRHLPAARRLDRLGRSVVGIPTVCGSRFQFFSDTAQTLEAIVRDIDAAERSVLMEFYIWGEGGRADEVLEAVIRAAQRGVSCCLLIDALGARPWWKGQQPRRLREAGVEIRPALPVGPLQMVFARTDLRLHRKIVIVDSHIAWTGSMNLVDPRFFKQDSGVGEWVDAMTRLQGSAVVPLCSTLISDWILETGQPLHQLVERYGLRLVEPVGDADIQVIPSGPGESGDGLLQMILTLIYAAEEELVLTTPYLVPDDSVLAALRSAAGRGVKVRLILPEKVDSLLTRYASRSYYDDLLDVGVEIYLYRGGLLHTKSIMVDGDLSMFGTVNLDLRSLWLNYEVALFVYQREFAGELRRLQQTYIDDSDLLDPAEWARRPFKSRLLENTFRLFSPLL